MVSCEFRVLDGCFVKLLVRKSRCHGTHLSPPAHVTVGGAKARIFVGLQPALLNMIKQTPKKMVPGMIPIAALIALSREIVEILP